MSRKIVIITEDSLAAATLSYVFASKNYYTAILEPPRMQRPDVSIEVGRILNVLSRVRPMMTLTIGLSEEARGTIETGNGRPVLSFANLGDLRTFLTDIDLDAWLAMSPEEAVNKLVDDKGELEIPIKAVLYNGPADVGYVIAANYAIHHKAKLVRFETPENLERDVIRKLNKIDSISDSQVRQIDIQSLRNALKSHLPMDMIEHNFERTLIITNGIPFGLVWPEKKTIHANRLMLGSFLAHNVYEKEWGDHERVGLVGLYVADRSVEWPGEYGTFEQAILRGRGLTKKLITSNPKLTELDIMTIPYDVMYVATHGKQLEGHKESYEFETADGNGHIVEVKRAAGIVSMVLFIESVDGVRKESEEWTDAQASIWGEFALHHLRDRVPLPDPTQSESIRLDMRSLVLGNEPGQNSPFSVQRLASNQRPVVIANACGSWTDMSPLFMFAGASAYIGTLWETVSSVAFEFARELNACLFISSLSDAFFNARDSLANAQDRMNYIITGSFENKYDSDIPFSSDGLTELRTRVARLLEVTTTSIESFTEDTPPDIKNNTEIDQMWYENILEELDEAD